MGNCHLFCIVPPLEKQFGNCVTIRALSVSAICVHSFITLRNSNDKSRSNCSSHYGAKKSYFKNLNWTISVILVINQFPISAIPLIVRNLMTKKYSRGPPVFMLTEKYFWLHSVNCSYCDFCH